MSRNFKVEDCGYEIRENKHNLQFVLLDEKTLKKIAQIYKRKYGILIDVVAGNADSLMKNTEEILKFYMSQMKVGEAVGILMLKTTFDQRIRHCNPLLLVKNHEEKFVLFDFESELSYTPLEAKLLEKDNLKISFASNYNSTQRDNYSCTIFSVNVLQHYLTDAEFIKTFVESDTDKIKWIEMKSTTLDQRRDSLSSMSEEKHAKYVHKVNGDHLNLKSLYKGHDYARKINPNHMSLLNEKTKKTVEEIDAIRAIFRGDRNVSGLRYPQARPLEAIEISCNIL